MIHTCKHPLWDGSIPHRLIETGGMSLQDLDDEIARGEALERLRERIPEVMTGMNRLLRGWSGYFHYRHSSRVMGKLNWQVRDRVKRWLWRKHGKKRALWSDYPAEQLQAQYGLWSLPEKAAWKHPCEHQPNAWQ